MPVGRYFRGLTAYDLLGNIIPGVVGLVVILGFLSSPPFPDSLGEYGLFAIFAFALGGVIQAHASTAVGQQRSFNITMDSVEALPSLQYSEAESDKADTENSEAGTEDNEESTGDDGEQDTHPIWNFCHPFIGPVFGWLRPERGKKLDDVILANRIWEHLVDTYEIPYSTESYNVLYHVMLSKVDDIGSPSRAIRIQALRNFYRGMWIASWYFLILLLLSLAANACLSTGETISVVGVAYAQPSYFQYWTPLWHLVVIAVGGVVVFWRLFESTEEDYIEYLFADYAVAIGSGEQSLTLAEDTELSLSGEVTAVLENQPPVGINGTAGADENGEEEDSGSD